MKRIYYESWSLDEWYSYCSHESPTIMVRAYVTIGDASFYIIRLDSVTPTSYKEHEHTVKCFIYTVMLEHQLIREAILLFDQEKSKLLAIMETKHDK